MKITYLFLGVFLICYGYCLNGQNWTQTASSHIQNNTIEVLDIDNSNKIYCASYYPDSLFVGDTSFVHTGHMYSENVAILVYDKNGEFEKAYDIHTIPYNPVWGLFVETDDDGNIYVACEFMRRIFLLDTVINHGIGPNIDSPEIAVFKISSSGNLEWAKVISSTSQDVVHGLKKTQDNNLYLMVEHYQSGVVNYMDQDTMVYDGSPKVLLKMSLEGEIIWKRKFKRLDNSISCRNFFVDENDNAFACGYSWGGGLIAESDTIFIPDYFVSTLPNFIVGFDKDGQTIQAEIFDCELIFTSIMAAPNGDLFFAAMMWTDSTLFGVDTLCISEDSTSKLIGRMNKNYEPVWYYQMRSRDIYLPMAFEIGYKSDTLYTAIRGIKEQNLAGVEYDLGSRQATLLVPFDVDGVSGIGRILKAVYQRYPSSLFIDHCDNLIMGGGYRGEGWFGDDTITSYRPQQSDGFVSKFNLGEHQSISIGNDTSIALSHDITFTAPSGFENYYWSNGFEGQTVTISGIDYGPGMHELWCKASNGNCVFSDTLQLQIIDDTYITENGLFNVVVYPNPFSKDLHIKYELYQTSIVEFSVYNTVGSLVYNIRHEQLSGNQLLKWKPANIQNGIYSFQLKIGADDIHGKLVYLKN